jgi:transposase-like protein
MKLLEDVRRVTRYVEEDENFWTEHLLKFSESGLSLEAYSRKEGINRNRFYYWKRVLGKKKLDGLLAKKSELPKLKNLLSIKIKEEDTKAGVVLCSVELINGLVLRIHEWSVVQQILSKGI